MMYFRGLLMAGLYQQTRRLALALIAPAALFMLLHLATSEPIWLLLFFTELYSAWYRLLLACCGRVGRR